jgi:hypothetical protein
LQDPRPAHQRKLANPRGLRQTERDGARADGAFPPFGPSATKCVIAAAELIDALTLAKQESDMRTGPRHASRSKSRFWRWRRDRSSVFDRQYSKSTGVVATVCVQQWRSI